MSITCTRRFHFCAGHRLAGHGGRCANLHGHNYVVLVTASADAQTTATTGLDKVGRVIDFSVLKDRIGSWINENWDHGFIVHKDDYRALNVLMGLDGVGFKQKVFLLPYSPTAENLARYLVKTVCPRVSTGAGVTVNAVQVWETENCYAEAVA